VKGVNLTLDEYTFRFNRRTLMHRGKLFFRLLQNTVKIEPTTFDQMKKTYGAEEYSITIYSSQDSQENTPENLFWTRTL